MPRVIIWTLAALAVGAAGGAAVALNLAPWWLGVGAAAAAGLMLGVFVIAPARRGRR